MNGAHTYTRWTVVVVAGLLGGCVDGPIWSGIHEQIPIPQPAGTEPELRAFVTYSGLPGKEQLRRIEVWVGHVKLGLSPAYSAGNVHHVRIDMGPGIEGTSQAHTLGVEVGRCRGGALPRTHDEWLEYVNDRGKFIESRSVPNR